MINLFVFSPFNSIHVFDENNSFNQPVQLMQQRSPLVNFFVLLFIFILSRLIARFYFHFNFQYGALYEYWQYLDVKSLQSNLLQSLWYQHSQPPVFNLLLGMVLKCSGMNASAVFEWLWMLISLCNAFLLMRILDRLVAHRYIPLAFAVFYTLNPATLLYEQELFYTCFTSLLLLSFVLALTRFGRSKSGGDVVAMFTSLTLLCLTRSSYHLLLLVIVCCLLLFLLHKRPGSRWILPAVIVSLVFVSGWYTKNYFIFRHFSASSWSGISLARITFHKEVQQDSRSIASVKTGLPLSYYKKYIDTQRFNAYAGMNDPVLLKEMKNDTAINMNHVGFISVSDKYREASEDFISSHPLNYAMKSATAFVIFFSPASSYFKLEENREKIKYYDLFYSFNLSHLFSGDVERRWALAFSAIPMFVIYGLVFFCLLRNGQRLSQAFTVNITIMTLISFILIASSLVESGENMRFRYELQPLFLVLAAQALLIFTGKTKPMVNKNL